MVTQISPPKKRQNKNGAKSQAKFGADLEARLNRYNASQLVDLADNIATSLNLEEWLASFPE